MQTPIRICPALELLPAVSSHMVVTIAMLKSKLTSKIKINKLYCRLYVVGSIFGQPTRAKPQDR